MRPLPTSPTNTFQSPKVATRAGLGASPLVPDLAAALAAGFVKAAAGGARAPTAQMAAAANPTARRDESTRLVIKGNPLNRAWPFMAAPGRGVFLPSDPGKIPAFRLAGSS